MLPLDKVEMSAHQESPLTQPLRHTGALGPLRDDAKKSDCEAAGDERSPDPSNNESTCIDERPEHLLEHLGTSNSLDKAGRPRDPPVMQAQQHVSNEHKNSAIKPTGRVISALFCMPYTVELRANSSWVMFLDAQNVENPI